MSRSSLAVAAQGLPRGPAPLRHLSRVGNVHIHWAEAGKGKPTILFHGLGDSHRTWRKIVPLLAPSRRLFMPDLPGHGLSDRPDAPYTLDWYASTLGAWIDSLGVRTFDVIGHSFGGGLAQMLLFTHGARIERLALVASGGLGPEVSLGLRLWSIADLSDRVTQSFLAPSTRLAIASLLPGADPEDVDFLSWMNAMPGSARALSRTVRAVVGWRGQKHQFADRAHEMVHPLPRVALFWGGQDNIVPVEHGAEMASRFEHVKLTRFEGCGHFPHQEQPEAFAAALAEFLEAPALEPAVLRGALVVVERTSRLRLWCMAFSRWILYWASWAAARARRLGTKRLPTDPPAEPSTRG